MKKLCILTTYAVGCLLIIGSAASPPRVNKNLTKVEMLGNFTAASSYNIRGLSYSSSNNTAVKVEGRSCYPFNPNSVPNQNGNLQLAMDNAISNGQKKGIDGDLLVNVRLKREVYSVVQLGSPEQSEVCYVVTGDLVQVE